jgi:tRNA (mo5U34)-methyltransferase
MLCTVRPMAQTLAAEVADYPWYHTLELGDGVVTSGMFDHRPVLKHYPLPHDLSGLRCLDVGTMDGFWAFEMERRGAREVVAVDAPDPLALDWPASLRATAEKTLDETKEERFALAHRALGSSVRRVARSVYDIDPEQLGSFDVVFCGDLLVHLRDPVGALERIHSVCSGSAIITNPIERFGIRDRLPLARLDGVDEFGWWTTNLAGLVRMVRAGGFSKVDPSRPFKLPFASGGGWKGVRGVVRALP